MKPESHYIARIMRLLSRKRWFVWRQNTGAASTTAGRLVRFGVRGTPDILAVKPHIIRARDVGRRVGLLVGIEVKTGRVPLTNAQRTFGDALKRAGAVYRVMRVRARHDR